MIHKSVRDQLAQRAAATERPRRVTVHVDLTGSKLGADWRSVDVELDAPEGCTDESIRADAARHYGVPISQVGDAVPFPRTVERWLTGG